MGGICDLFEAAGDHRAMLEELKEGIKKNKAKLKEYILYFCLFAIGFIVAWLYLYLNYCSGTCDIDTFQWVFSTLAQVFGTLLGLYIVALFYVNDKICDAQTKIIQMRLEKRAEYLEEIESVNKSFWNTSIVVIIFFISIIIYSIIILSSSNALIDTNFADYIILYLGILFPLSGMIILIKALTLANAVTSVYKATLKLELREKLEND